MRRYPSAWNRAQSDAFAQPVRRLIDERGWGFWAAEERASGQFIAFVGLDVPSDDLPFSPCVEVGWRPAKPHWGLGYAMEAAQSAIAFGFQQLHLKELGAFTAVANQKSRHVMERLGRRLDSEFDHPQVLLESRLRRHVSYRLRPPV